MFSGFDFGTSNCAIGTVGAHSGVDQIELSPISHGSAYMPSAIYTLQRDLICESVAIDLKDGSEQQQFLALRQRQLAQAQNVRRSENIPSGEQCVFVGKDAVDEYMRYPDEGYFIKSPKSFLGSSELQPEAISFFEDIVTKMMLSVKQKAESGLEQSIDHTVIGRPVNFQGLDSDKSNKRAIDILTVSAKRAGFKSVEYLFEPIAAGIDFESTLELDKTVLVVDIGGGTSDCSMVRMGPSHRDSFDRSGDILGFSGMRFGGNDYDIKLAEKNIMPLFGMNTSFKDGIIIPNTIFKESVQTNNIGAQTNFYNQTTAFRLKRYLAESAQPKLIERFIQLRSSKKIQRLIQSAEQCKIALSEHKNHRIDLDYIEDELSFSASREQFSNAIIPIIERSHKLIDDVIEQAQCQPGLVYMTGGAAKANIIRDVLIDRFGEDKVRGGDYYGSVAKGLTMWAQKLYS